MLKKLFVRAGIPAATMMAAGSAFATAPTTIGELASSVSFSDVGLAILAVAGAVITLYMVWKGSKFVIHAVKGA
jgi:hypothetical protein